MPKSSVRYVCQTCGAVQPRWSGKCDACNAWNSIAEETDGAAPGRTGGSRARSARRLSFVPLSGPREQAPRLTTGNAEFDRVTGGGLVNGSVTLVGGDPGIGKSTLMLQIAAALSQRVPCAYISGEEAIDQIRLRAERLEVMDRPVRLGASISLDHILASLEGPDAPKVAVIDSIQTMFLEALDSAPGTVGQVRACAQALVRAAKQRGVVILIVGHVTKDGAIAGPRVMEHMVDTVLYFEGERGHPFRILRSVKNRFGATSEIGVFDMTERGLREVPNPSELFLADRQEGVAGAVVFAGMEGSRPVLVEMQALVAPSPLGTPRRTVVGWDGGRLAMVLAVLEARAGYRFSGNDVYLNVAGGLRISEPAADLAAAAALVSSLEGAPIPTGMAAFGEVGLSGEIRSVSQMDARLREAAKLGFTMALTPRRRGKAKAGAEAGLRIRDIAQVRDLDGLFSA